MLAKKFHLNLKEEKNRDLFRQGFRWRQGAFQATYDFRGKTPQFAAIVPKAVLAKSTDRNAVRRKIFAALPAELLAKENLRLVVRVTSAQAKELDQQTIQDWFSRLLDELKKAHL